MRKPMAPDGPQQHRAGARAPAPRVEGSAADPFVAEVLALHTYLDAWLKGTVPRHDGVPTRLRRALARDFLVVHPDGGRGDKAQVLERFAAAYGEKPPGYRLEVEPLATRRPAVGLALVTYRETHRGEVGRARIANALLRRRAAGIEWLFLQETLLGPSDESGAAAD